MNKISLPILFVLLFAVHSLMSQTGPKNEIDTLLTAWHQAAALADEAVYFGAMDDDFVFLGTDASERWERLAFVKWAMPYFLRDSAWVFRATQRHITIGSDGKTAWFDELLDSKSYWPTRGSGVLCKTEKGWKLRQYNMAFTIPNDSVKDIRPFIEKAIKEQKK